MAIQALLFPGAHCIPGMETGCIAGEIPAQPPAIAEALKHNAAVLTADAVIVADPFGVVTKLHS